MKLNCTNFDPLPSTSYLDISLVSYKRRTRERKSLEVLLWHVCTNSPAIMRSMASRHAILYTSLLLLLSKVMPTLHTNIISWSKNCKVTFSCSVYLCTFMYISMYLHRYICIYVVNYVAYSCHQ